VAPARPSEIATALHRFGLQRDRLRSALSRASGLALADLDALEHLEADGPLTQRQLGDRLLLTSGAVTILVDRLERTGLVTRRRHPDDRRAVLVELGHHASAPEPQALTDYHAAVAAAARAIAPDHREAVRSFLAQVAEQAAQATSGIKTGS
jgi:DNA-binding MarR family transcriptional regulator